MVDVSQVTNLIYLVAFIVVVIGGAGLWLSQKEKREKKEASQAIRDKAAALRQEARRRK